VSGGGTRLETRRIRRATSAGGSEVVVRESGSFADSGRLRELRLNRVRRLCLVENGVFLASLRSRDLSLRNRRKQVPGIRVETRRISGQLGPAAQRGRRRGLGAGERGIIQRCHSASACVSRVWSQSCSRSRLRSGAGSSSRNTGLVLGGSVWSPTVSGIIQGVDPVATKVEHVQTS